MSNPKRPQGQPAPYPYEQPRRNTRSQLLIRQATLEAIVAHYDHLDRNPVAYKRYAQAVSELRSINQQLGLPA